MTGFKRIASFGGWAFSTDPSTYNIFREGVADGNRATLVASIVDFVNKVGCARSRDAECGPPCSSRRIC